MADNGFPYIEISEDIRATMEFISTCRDENCAVPKKHPFYPVPEQPPFYYGKRPCMPVVPTRLTTQKIMIIGEYPNARYATDKNDTTGQPEKFVPVADINEPFEGGRYYDTHSVRDYPTFASLQVNYLTPLGLDLDLHIWLTNINKCFLMSPANIQTYKDIGWNEPETKASFASDDDYFAIGAVCALRHLPRELELCQPKLIIALGLKAYRMVHSSNDFKTPAPPINFTDITGKILPANNVTTPLDRRGPLFQKYNVVHLFHPSFFARGAAPANIDLHRNVHIPAVKAFIQSNNIL